MTFGKWDSSIHEEIDQIKRINTSKQIKPKNIKILDIISLTAIMIGSDGDLYEVSLDRCTCFDFTSRQLPCKHIYRLADEVGLLPKQPTLNPEEVATFKQNIPAEIARFKRLYESGAISVDKFIKIVNALNSK